VTQDIADERRDRCRALSDVSRLTDDVARAAAETIQRAERKFVTELAADNSRSGRRTGEASPSLGAVVGVAATGQSSGSLFNGSEQVARLLGEMEAEIRVAFDARIRLLSTELRSEILGEMSVRVAAVEAHLGTVEATLSAELRRAASDLGVRVRALEGGQYSRAGSVPASLGSAPLDDPRRQRGLMGAGISTTSGSAAAPSVSSDPSASNSRVADVGIKPLARDRERDVSDALDPAPARFRASSASITGGGAAAAAATARALAAAAKEAAAPSADAGHADPVPQLGGTMDSSHSGKDTSRQRSQSPLGPSGNSQVPAKAGQATRERQACIQMPEPSRRTSESPAGVPSHQLQHLQHQVARTSAQMVSAKAGVLGQAASAGKSTQASRAGSSDGAPQPHSRHSPSSCGSRPVMDPRSRVGESASHPGPQLAQPGAIFRPGSRMVSGVFAGSAVHHAAPIALPQTRATVRPGVLSMPTALR